MFVNPIKLSEFASSFDSTFDSNCSTGPVAVWNPIKLGWVHMFNISLHRFLAIGTLLLSVSVILLILAAVPSSWIWLPKYFSDFHRVYRMTALARQG